MTEPFHAAAARALLEAVDYDQLGSADLVSAALAHALLALVDVSPASSLPAPMREAFHLAAARGVPSMAQVAEPVA